LIVIRVAEPEGGVRSVWPPERVAPIVIVPATVPVCRPTVVALPANVAVAAFAAILKLAADPVDKPIVLSSPGLSGFGTKVRLSCPEIATGQEEVSERPIGNCVNGVLEIPPKLIVGAITSFSGTKIDVFAESVNVTVKL
jgi:hypothetical protein